MKKKLVYMIFLILVATAWKCDPGRQSVSPPPVGPETVAPPPPSNPVDCGMEWAVDVTSSGDDRPVRSTLERAGVVLLNSGVCRLLVIRLGEGGESVWSTPAKNFDLPLIPMDVFDQGAAEQAMPPACRARLKCREERLAKLRSAFGEEKNKRTDAATNERKRLIQEAIDFAAAKPNGIAACSDMIAFADRILGDGFRRFLLITDGEHDCKSQIEHRSFAPGVKGLVLQLEVKGANGNSGFRKRAEVLQKIFGGEQVTVTPLVSVSDSIVRSLL